MLAEVERPLDRPSVRSDRPHVLRATRGQGDIGDDRDLILARVDRHQGLEAALLILEVGRVQDVAGRLGREGLGGEVARFERAHDEDAAARQCHGAETAIGIRAILGFAGEAGEAVEDRRLGIVLEMRVVAECQVAGRSPWPVVRSTG